MPLEAAFRLACRGGEMMMFTIWLKNVLFNQQLRAQKYAVRTMQNGLFFKSLGSVNQYLSVTNLLQYSSTFFTVIIFYEKYVFSLDCSGVDVRLHVDESAGLYQRPNGSERGDYL